MAELTRRRILGGVGALAGSLGASTLWSGVAGGSAPAADASQRLELVATGLTTVGGRARRVVGASVAHRALLHRAADGAAEGELFVTSTLVAAHRVLTDATATGAIETHTFVLPEGSITGTGTVDHSGRGTFAVTGGTGAYHGSRGSYTVAQELDRVAGAGRYVFELMVEGSPRGR